MAANQKLLKKSRKGHGGDIYSQPDRTWLDLSANINPHPLPPALIQALPRILADARAYPDIEYRALRRLLAKHVSSPGRRIPMSWVIPGNGAVELLDKTIRTFRKGLLLQPSFSEYELSFVRHEVPYAIIGRLPDPPGLLGRGLKDRICTVLAEDPAIDGLVLCSPNNPDGALWDSFAFTALLEKCRELGVTVLLDETFGDYLEPHQMLAPMVCEFENLVVVKALTKFFGLPGIRLGYAITRDQQRRDAIAAGLTTWNVGAFAQGAAEILLADRQFIQSSRQENQQERELLFRALRTCGLFDAVYYSSANFIMVHSPIIKSIIAGLRDQGILIRDLENLRGLPPGHARIAVKAGTRPTLMAALERIAEAAMI